MMRTKVIKETADKLTQYFAQAQDSVLIWVALCLGLGSASYFALEREPSFAFTGFLLASSLVVGLRLHRMYHSLPLSRNFDRQNFIFLARLCALACVLMATGFGLAQLRTWMCQTPMIVSETKPLKITGTLESMGNPLILKNLLIEDKFNGVWPVEKTPIKIRLSTKIPQPGPHEGDHTQAIKAGDRVSLLAKLMPPMRPTLPGGYDYARHYYFESVGGTGFALSPLEKLNDDEAAPDSLWANFLSWLENSRQNIAQSIRASIEPQTAGIAIALMTGERADIADEDWTALRASGLAHIISISGLHVAMVAAPVFFIVRFLLALFPPIALRYNIKKWAACCALLACSLYVGFVEPSVPTTRALLMTGIALLAVMFDRSPFSLRLIGFSAIVILITAPESVWSASFQMSFAAVTALVAGVNHAQKYIKGAQQNPGIITKSATYLLTAILTSFVASLATAPFVWFHFQQFSTYSILGNLLAMPISGLVIMPGVMLGLLLWPFGAAHYPILALGWGIEWLLTVARVVQDLPYSYLTGHMSPFPALIAIIICGFIFLLVQGRWKWAALPFLMFSLLACIFWQPPKLMLSNDGNLLLLTAQNNGENIAYVSSLRRDKFTQRNWVQHLGVGKSAMMPREQKIVLSNAGNSFSEEFFICDAALCHIEIAQQKIAYGSSYPALFSACSWADYIISPRSLGRNFCAQQSTKKSQPHIMDRSYFKRHGAILFEDKKSLFAPQKLSVRTTLSPGDNRPWHLH